MDELVVVGGTIANLPINLRHAIVHPTFSIPQQHVGIEVVIVLQTISAAAVGVALLVTIDAEGRDANLHPRLGVVNGTIELFDKQVDVIAAPVATVADAVVVGAELGCVGNLNASHGIGIEVVIDVQSIDVIACHDVADDIADIVAAGLQGRVQQRQTVVLERPFGMLHNDMVASIAVCRLRLGTIGVNPCVQLHAALVALVDHPSQRVPIGIGFGALFAGQVVAPWLDVALIEGVALGPHLEDDGVAAVFLQLVQLVRQRLFHRLGTHALKLSVHALNPGAAELAFVLRWQNQCKQQHQSYRQYSSHILKLLELFTCTSSLRDPFRGGPPFPSASGAYRTPFYPCTERCPSSRGPSRR